MRKVFSLYGQILWPWLCVVVYLWAVELQAVFSLADHEPLTDRLADCSAILYTLIFWTMIGCAALVLPGLLFGRSVIIRINTLVCKAILVFITALYFIRWLVKWVILYTSYEAILWLLAATVSVLGIVALRWRKETRNFTDSNFHSLRECFYFAVVPVLLG